MPVESLNFFISSQRLCSLCIIYAKLCGQLVPETCRRFSAKLFESAVIVFHHMICQTLWILIIMQEKHDTEFQTIIVC